MPNGLFLNDLLNSDKFYLNQILSLPKCQATRTTLNAPTTNAHEQLGQGSVQNPSKLTYADAKIVSGSYAAPSTTSINSVSICSESATSLYSLHNLYSLVARVTRTFQWCQYLNNLIMRSLILGKMLKSMAKVILQVIWPILRVIDSILLANKWLNLCENVVGLQQSQVAIRNHQSVETNTSRRHLIENLKFKRVV